MQSLNLSSGRSGSSSPCSEHHKRRQLPAPFCFSEQSTKAGREICISSFLKFSHPLGIPRGRGTTAPVVYREGNAEKKYLENTCSITTVIRLVLYQRNYPKIDCISVLLMLFLNFQGMRVFQSIFFSFFSMKILRIFELPKYFDAKHPPRLGEGISRHRILKKYKLIFSLSEVLQSASFKSYSFL